MPGSRRTMGPTVATSLDPVTPAPKVLLADDDGAALSADVLLFPTEAGAAFFGDFLNMSLISRDPLGLTTDAPGKQNPDV